MVNESYITDLLLIFLVVLSLVVLIDTFLAMIRIAVFFKILGSLLLTLHASLSELLHYLEKLLSIVLEKVVRDCENVTCEYSVKWYVSGHKTKKVENSPTHR